MAVIMESGWEMIPKISSIFNLIWDMNKNKNSKYKKENEIEKRKSDLKTKIKIENENQFCNYNKKGEYENDKRNWSFGNE